jgi:hypothetical protein
LNKNQIKWNFQFFFLPFDYYYYLLLQTRFFLWKISVWFEDEKKKIWLLWSVMVVQPMNFTKTKMIINLFIKYWRLLLTQFILGFPVWAGLFKLLRGILLYSYISTSRVPKFPFEYSSLDFSKIFKVFLRVFWGFYVGLFRFFLVVSQSFLWFFENFFCRFFQSFLRFL